MSGNDNMEDKDSDSRGDNRGSHNNRDRSKGAGGATNRLEMCSEGRVG